MASMVLYDNDRVYERGMVVNGVEGGSGWVKVYFVPNGRGVSTALFKLHIEGVMASLPVRLLFSSCEDLWALRWISEHGAANQNCPSASGS